MLTFHEIRQIVDAVVAPSTDVHGVLVASALRGDRIELLIVLNPTRSPQRVLLNISRRDRRAFESGLRSGLQRAIG